MMRISFVKLVLYPSSLFLEDETDTFNNYFLMGYLGENLIEPNETIQTKISRIDKKFRFRNRSTTKVFKFPIFKG